MAVRPYNFKYKEGKRKIPFEIPVPPCGPEWLAKARESHQRISKKYASPQLTVTKA